MFSCAIGEGAELRLLEARHARELFALIETNRDHLGRWMSWVGATRSPDDTRDFIVRALRRFARNNGFAVGIWRSGRIAGTIDLHAIHWDYRSSSLGYWIGREHEGLGLVTAACRAILAHSFEDLRLNRLEIRCAPENLRSRAVAERLGFREEGVLRQAQRVDDGYLDHVVYAMLRDEWRARRGPGSEGA